MGRAGGSRPLPLLEPLGQQGVWVLAQVALAIGVAVGHPIADLLVPEGDPIDPAGGQLGGGHGRDQLAHVDWGEVRSHVLASDLHQLGKSGRHDRVGQFAEDLRQHQLLALHPTDVTQLIVAEAQESLQ